MMTCQFLTRLRRFLRACFAKGDSTVIPEAQDSTPPIRISRPIQPTLVLYLAQAEPGADSSDAAVADALAKVKGWKEFSAGFGGTARLAPRRAFKDSPGLDELVAKASRNAQSMGVRGYRPLDYKRYFLLSVPSSAGASSADTYCELKAGLQRIGGRVFLSMPTRRAAATNDYLGSAQAVGGIGASQLVSSTNAPVDGDGQWLVDVEKAWLTPSDNFNSPVLALPTSANVAESAELADIHHGTAVAGIVLGAAGQQAIGGIAPRARFFKGPCLELSGAADPSQILASTILDAAVLLSQSPRGTGVLLIEQETWDAFPVECLPLEFAAIQTAAAAGHIVIQPAGNGAQDLNGAFGLWFDPANNLAQRPLDPAQNGPTSGAIIVGAGCSGHDAVVSPFGERSPSSNYGRVTDCWAWGDSIATLGVTRDAAGAVVAFPDPAGFGGTSGAAAMVAGAVLLMQHLRQAEGRAQLTPAELRAHLRNPALGTDGQGDLKGSFMPDLAKLKSVL